MSLPDFVRAHSIKSVSAVWIAAAVLGIVVGIVAEPNWRAAWMALALGGCILLAFGIQLWQGRPQGFIRRVAASILGALAVMSLIGIGLGLASLFSA